MGLRERMEEQRTAQAAARGQALPSDLYADGTRKPEWVVRAEQGRLSPKVLGGSSERYTSSSYDPGR